MQFETRITRDRYETRLVFYQLGILITSCICMAVNEMPTCMQLDTSRRVHREPKATASLKINLQVTAQCFGKH